MWILSNDGIVFIYKTIIQNFMYFYIIYNIWSQFPYDRLFNRTKNHCSFTTYVIVMEFVCIQNQK